MTHRDRAGDPPGRREAAGDAGHRQGFPTPAPIRPLPVRPRDRNGGFPRLSGCVAHGYRCPASPRHALLAESLGKPSLWVIISAPWYETAWFGPRRGGRGENHPVRGRQKQPARPLKGRAGCFFRDFFFGASSSLGPESRRRPVLRVQPLAATACCSPLTDSATGAGSRST